jgi:hypothetical protein
MEQSAGGSEMFDPEKVERMVIYESSIIRNPVCPVEPLVGVVRSSAYDQLLELYRALQRQMNQGVADSRYVAEGFAKDSKGQWTNMGCGH